MNSIYDSITLTVIIMTGALAYACSPFLTDGVVMLFEKFFGPLYNEDEDDEDFH